MDLKVYDEENNWVRVPNAPDVTSAKKHAQSYGNLIGELRVFEMKTVEVPVESEL